MLCSVKKSLSRVVSFITALVMIVAISVFPKQTARATSIPDNQLNDMAIEVAFLVNSYRLENGLHPIYVIPYLCDTARVRSRECIEYFDHFRPDGSKFSTIIDTNLIPYAATFENIAAGRSTPEGAMDQWINSEKHRNAILNPDLTHMGIGVAYEPNSDYGYYWTQLFVITDAHFQNEYIPRRYDIIPQTEGDITGDAIVDTFDYLSLADYIYKRSKNIPVYFNEEQLNTADCFRDGLITESDAKVLVRYILGEYDTLPYVF
ncbi:MAG: SCP-like extracellular [Ruminococcus sp.]|nr:SCP-like extracellular [Ruminococcus sp.]